jgi:hypothetical protein
MTRYSTHRPSRVPSARRAECLKISAFVRGHSRPEIVSLAGGMPYLAALPARSDVGNATG